MHKHQMLYLNKDLVIQPAQNAGKLPFGRIEDDNTLPFPEPGFFAVSWFLLFTDVF